MKNPRALYHVVGTPQQADRQIASLPMQADWLLTHRVTEDGRYLIVHAGVGGSTRNRVFFQRLDAPTRAMSPLIDQADASYTFFGNHGDRWYFYTDKDAPQGRVIAIDICHPRADRWQTIVPELSEAIAAHDQTGGNALGMFGNRFVLMYLRDGHL